MTLILSLIQFCSWLPVKIVYETNVLNKVFRFDMTAAKNIKMNENNISRYIINSNSENYIKKNKSSSNILNLIKNDNEENNKEMSKNNTNFNFTNSKNKCNTNTNQLSIKTNHRNDLITNMEHSNAYMIMNNVIQKRTLNINQIPNIFREVSENNQYMNRERIRRVKSQKYISNIIKFNCCQLLCYSPTKHCSRNIKINLAKNAQNYFRKTLDIISVFQDAINNKKIIELIMNNR